MKAAEYLLNVSKCETRNRQFSHAASATRREISRNSRRVGSRRAQKISRATPASGPAENGSFMPGRCPFRGASYQSRALAPGVNELCARRSFLSFPSFRASHRAEPERPSHLPTSLRCSRNRSCNRCCIHSRRGDDVRSRYCSHSYSRIRTTSLPFHIRTTSLPSRSRRTSHHWSRNCRCGDGTIRRGYRRYCRGYRDHRGYHRCCHSCRGQTPWPAFASRPGRRPWPPNPASSE